MRNSQQVNTDVEVCDGDKHRHMAFQCMNCMRETICRSCKFIEDDQHICKLCSISLSFDDPSAGNGTRAETLFESARPEQFSQIAGVTRNRETGELVGFDQICAILDIEASHEHKSTALSYKQVTSEQYTVIEEVKNAEGQQQLALRKAG